MAADKFMRDYGYGAPPLHRLVDPPPPSLPPPPSWPAVRTGIRYNYGLEGKRQDWSAMSCGKIINSSGTRLSRHRNET